MKKTKESYPRFQIKFILNGTVVNCVTSKKLLRILYRIRHFGANNKWDKAFLRFRYTPKYHNEGYYTNSRDLEHAYRCFEELLVEFKI